MPLLRSIAVHVVGAALAIALGLVAVRFQILDSWLAVAILGLVVAALIGLGLRAESQPFDDTGD